ncbi:MAG: hypothetical protein ACYDA3_09690 [Gaiellaceae bacterium]
MLLAYRFPVASYAYDPTVTAGVDELTSISQGGTTNYAYTTDGQTSQRGSDTLTWNGWGELTGGTFAATSVTYTRDALGNLRQRSSGTNTTRYLYAGTSTPIFETNASGTITEANADGTTGDLAHYAGPSESSVTQRHQSHSNAFSTRTIKESESWFSEHWRGSAIVQ